MLPTFVVIGSMKGGTTSLAAYLGSHPDVFMATPKELDFFSNHWESGPEFYERFFDDAGDAIARGEASPRYSRAPKYSDVPKRMASIDPELRIVYLLRHPIDRIRSMYAHWWHEGHERRSIDVAVRTRSEYVDSSRYAHQIELYLEHFDREQLLVLDSDRLRTDRETTLREVFAFIGVDPDVQLANVDEEFNVSAQRTREAPVGRAVRNTLEALHVRRLIPSTLRAAARRTMIDRPDTGPDTSLPRDLEADLWAELQPDVERLRALVGPDFDLWGRA